MQMLQLYMHVIGIWMTSQKKLETESLTIFNVNSFNSVNKVNNGKSQVMLTKDDKWKINAWGSLICNETTVKLLGVTVENKLFFELHLNTVCKKVC